MSTTEPTGVDLDAARALIAVCRWTYAKTVPEAPHECCLRAWLSPDHQADFDWFVAVIAEHGYRGQFWGREWVYLDVDDRRYWESRTLDGTGINRAHLDEPSRCGHQSSARRTSPGLHPSRRHLGNEPRGHRAGVEQPSRLQLLPVTTSRAPCPTLEPRPLPWTASARARAALESGAGAREPAARISRLVAYLALPGLSSSPSARARRRAGVGS